MHTHSVHALELRIPPVAVVILAAVLMWIGVRFAPSLNFKVPFQSVLASIAALFGLITCAAGVVEFKRARTTVNPTKPQTSSSLVTSGIYRHTRNPMYLGFFLMLVGWALAIGNMLALLGLPAFVLYLGRFQIKPEERALLSIFGDDFKDYCSTVRRWI